MQIAQKTSRNDQSMLLTPLMVACGFTRGAPNLARGESIAALRDRRIVPKGRGAPRTRRSGRLDVPDARDDEGDRDHHLQGGQELRREPGGGLARRRAAAMATRARAIAAAPSALPVAASAPELTARHASAGVTRTAPNGPDGRGHTIVRTPDAPSTMPAAMRNDSGLIASAVEQVVREDHAHRDEGDAGDQGDGQRPGRRAVGPGRRARRARRWSSRGTRRPGTRSSIALGPRSRGARRRRAAGRPSACSRPRTRPRAPGGSRSPARPAGRRRMPASQVLRTPSRSRRSARRGSSPESRHSAAAASPMVPSPAPDSRSGLSDASLVLGLETDHGAEVARQPAAVRRPPPPSGRPAPAPRGRTPPSDPAGAPRGPPPGPGGSPDSRPPGARAPPSPRREGSPHEGEGVEGLAGRELAEDARDAAPRGRPPVLEDAPVRPLLGDQEPGEPPGEAVEAGVVGHLPTVDEGDDRGARWRPRSRPPPAGANAVQPSWWMRLRRTYPSPASAGPMRPSR